MKKVLKVMDRSGDSSVAFDTEVDDAAKSEARKFFDDLMAKGGNVFAIGPDGKGDGPIRNFDQLGEENIVVPRIAGG